jgi:sulfopyruvate decarboxylase subunit alpha
LSMGYKEDACAAVIEGLEAIGIEFFIHIPDSFGAPVIAHFENKPEVRAFPVAREEEGIGIASGLAMTGKKGVLFCQDVGLGNSMVALTTFVMAYHVPMLVLAIRRGGFGEFNAAAHNYSETAVDMVESMKIKSSVLDYRVPFGEWPKVIWQAYDYSHMTHRPIVVFLNLKE